MVLWFFRAHRLPYFNSKTIQIMFSRVEIQQLNFLNNYTYIFSPVIYCNTSVPRVVSGWFKKQETNR